MTAAPTARRRRWPGAKISPTSSRAWICPATTVRWRPILIDLAQRDTINRSSRFAETALNQLASVTDILARSPHRSASLAVLVAPDVPAVLIELGYLSNRCDAAQMNTDAWRARVAQAIADAVDRQFRRRSGNSAMTPVRHESPDWHAPLFNPKEVLSSEPRSYGKARSLRGSMVRRLLVYAGLGAAALAVLGAAGGASSTSIQ